MTQPGNNFVKILFRFYSSVLEQWTVETMWAEIIDEGRGLYKIDNIPFFASISPGDIVFAEYDKTEQFLTYRETVEYSGSSLVHVVMIDKSFITNDIRQIFSSMGCESEKFKEGYFAMEIPVSLDYKPIKQKLLELQEKGIIDYAEPVLSDNHRY
jgi:hypothetical protein